MTGIHIQMNFNNLKMTKENATKLIYQKFDLKYKLT